jgi:uncharacterized membrane protein YeaQ/YmgE (transglycosylase-associated protein family)
MFTFAALVLGFALNPGGIIAWLVIGLLAGLIAGFLVKGSGFGIIGDLIVGLIGAIIGGFIASHMGSGGACCSPLLARSSYC